MTEKERIEARNIAASDYLRRRHQARLEQAHRVPATRWPGDGFTPAGRLVLRVMLVGGIVGALVGMAGQAFAAPPPNAAAPLAWPTRSVEAAAHRWVRELAPDALGNGVRLLSDKWACEQTKRRPARYRCEGAVLWIEAGEYVETREVLSRCRPSRRVTGNGATWTTARVLVRREGARRGGLLCARRSS